MAPQSCSTGSSGKVFAGLFLEVGLYSPTSWRQPSARDLRVVLHAERILHLAQARFQVFLGQADDDARIHLHEAAIGVPREAVVLGGLRQAFDGLRVQPEVEDRLHHAGHGARRTGAHADQQRIVGVAELLLGEFFEVRQVLGHFRAQLLGILSSVLEVVVAGFRGDGESGRNGQPNLGHFSKAGALSAENFPHVALAVRFTRSEKINVFHVSPSSSSVCWLVGAPITQVTFNLLVTS